MTCSSSSTATVGEGSWKIFRPLSRPFLPFCPNNPCYEVEIRTPCAFGWTADAVWRSLSSMELDRRQKYLENLLKAGTRGAVKALVPVVNRWDEVLTSIPGLNKRHPGTHSRIADLSAGLLTVEADHAAWLQLLQWHQGEILSRLQRSFPTLSIRALQFRLTRAGEPVERPNVVMPAPVKTQLSVAEQTQLDSLIGDLELLIGHKREAGESSAGS